MVDPTKQRTMPINGTVSALRAQSATYILEWALGPQPADNAWHKLTSAVPVVNGSYTGSLATLDLSQIPSSFFEKAYSNGELTRTSTNPNLADEQYALTFRIRVQDNLGNLGQDRRAVYVQPKNQEPSGWPIRLPQGGESQPVIASLNGARTSDVIVGDADGNVYAFDSQGRNLPGWPVRTGLAPEPTPYLRAAGYKDVTRPREAVLTAPAVGSLFGNGDLDVVVSTSSGNVYAWDSKGKLLSGFPVSISRHLTPSKVPTAAFDGRTGMRGTWAAPVLADLNGDGRLEIVQSSWDDWVYAIRPDGSDLPGWPVQPVLRASQRQQLISKGYKEWIDARVIAPPSVGDINGDGRLEVIVGSEELYYGVGSGGSHPVYAIYADGNAHPGGPFLPGWPALLPGSATHAASFDFLGEGVLAAQLVDLNGNLSNGAHGPLSVVATTNGGNPVVLNANGAIVTTLASTGPGRPGATQNFTGTGAVQYTADGPRYFQEGVSQSGGATTPIVNAMRGWNVKSGEMLSGFPRVQQGGGFNYGAPAIAPVTVQGGAAVIQGTDMMTIHAFDASGASVEASGWPKFTGGWVNWAPGVGDVLGDGHVAIAFATREGWVHLILTTGRMADAQWCAWQGGPRHTGVGDCSAVRTAR
jgi:hypothetical protein